MSYRAIARPAALALLALLCAPRGVRGVGTGTHACYDGTHSCGAEPGITCTPAGTGWNCGCAAPAYRKDPTQTAHTVCVDLVAAAAPEPCIGSGCLACRSTATSSELNMLHGLKRYRKGGFAAAATNDASVLAVCPRAATAYADARKTKDGATRTGTDNGGAGDPLEGCALDGGDAGRLRADGPALDNLDILASAASSDAPLAYLQGTASTPIFGFVVGLLTALAGFTFVCARWCLGRCCSKNGEGRCGGRYPTIATEAYPRKTVDKARGCMVAFVLLLAVLLGCVQQRGNLALGPAMVAIAEAPHGAADLAAALPAPALDFAQSVLGKTLVTLIASVNASFVGTLELRGAAEDVRCLVDGVGTARALPGVVLAALRQLKVALGMLPSLALVDRNITTLNASAANVKASVATLNNSLARLDTAIVALQTGPSLSAPAIDLAGNASRLAPIAAAISSNVTALEASLPTVAQLDGVNTAVSAVTQDATTNPSGGARPTTEPLTTGAVARQDTRDKLVALRDRCAAVSVATLVGEVRALNATLDSIASSANATLHAVEALNHTLLDTLPPGAPIIAALGAIDEALASYDPVALRALVTSLNGSLNALPPLPPLETAARSLPPVLHAVVPCAASLSARLARVGVEVFALPPFATNLQERVADLNSSASDAIDSVNKLADSIADADAQLQNASGARADLNEVLDTLPNRSALALERNTTELQADIASIDANRTTAVDALGGLKTSATTLRDGASNPADRPAAAVVSKLESMQAQLTDTVPKITEAIDALDLWGRGLCASATGAPVPCDCAPGADPVPPSFVCGTAGAEWGCVDSDGIATTCDKRLAYSTDTISIVSGKAVDSQTSIADARTELVARPSSAKLTSQMDDLQSAATDGEPPDGALDSLVDLEAALQKLPADDVADWRRQVADLDGPINDLPDFANLRENLRQVNDTVEALPTATIDERTQQLEDVERALPNATLLADTKTCTRDVVDFVYGVPADSEAPVLPYTPAPDDLAAALPALVAPPRRAPSLHRALAELAHERQLQISAQHGRCEAFAYLAAAAEDFANEAGAVCANLTGGASSVAQRIRDVRRSSAFGAALRRCRRLTLPEAQRRAMGSAAYLLDIVDAEWAVTPSEADFSAVGSSGFGPQVTVDADDVAWSDGGMCLQLRCIENSVKRFNTGSHPLPGSTAQPASQIADPSGVQQAASSGDSSTDMLNSLISVNGQGRERAFSLLLLPFVLVILCGVAALVLRKGCCALTMALLIFCIAPWVLWFGSASLYPVVLLADGCAAVGPLATAATFSNDGAICAALGGNMSATMADGITPVCAVSFANGVVNASFSLQSARVAAELVSGCDGANTGDAAAFEALWDGVSAWPSSVSEELRARVLEYNGTNRSSSGSADGGDAGFTPGVGPGITSAGLDAAADVGLHAALLVQGYRRTFTCAAVSQTVLAAKDAVCCSAGGAFFWLTGGWVAVGLALSCVGTCAGIYGHKRLARRTWGPHAVALRQKSDVYSGEAGGARAAQQQQQQQQGTLHQGYAAQYDEGIDVSIEMMQPPRGNHASVADPIENPLKAGAAEPESSRGKGPRKKTANDGWHRQASSATVTNDSGFI